MKAYTDLEQSKKLSEILPHESADMYYNYNVGINSYYEDVPRVIQANNHFAFFHQDVPCWSLAALLNVLPKGTNITTPDALNKVRYSCWNDYDITYASNIIDACYEMILKLNELNLL